MCVLEFDYYSDSKKYMHLNSFPRSDTYAWTGSRMGELKRFKNCTLKLEIGSGG